MKFERNNYFLKFIILSVIVFFFFYINKINEFPSYIHSWTQSDRYAIALGFIDNNFDFLHPQTYNLRPNPDFEPEEESGITPVDFPIHEFNVAILMKIFGTKSPWVFKMYIFIYGLIGIYLIGLLAYKISKNQHLGIFLSGFIISCPVFTYYLAGFIPTITSLSSFFIALYFYINYLINKKKSYFVFSVLFLTLSALSRTPFNIILLALFLTEVLLFIKRKTFEFYKVISFIVSFTFVLIYFVYNYSLGLRYGSGFLNTFLPPDDISDLFHIINLTLKNWSFHYFTIFHYLFIIFTLWIIFKNYKNIRLKKFQKIIALLIFICSLGVLTYGVLMANQFPAHDYYFYDSFFPILILLGVLVISIIAKFKLINHPYTNYVIYGLLISFFITSGFTQSKRRKTGFWDRREITKNNFNDSKQFLDSIGIPSNTKILVIDAYTTNTPLILMDRKGYTVLTTSEENIKQALDWNYDYIAIQDEFLITDVIKGYPEIINLIEKITGNGKISIYKKRETPMEISLLSFLDFENQTPVFESKMNFDSIPDKLWSNISVFKSDSSANNYGQVDEKVEYGITLAIHDPKIIKHKNHSMLFTGDFYSFKKNTQCKIVSSLSIDGHIEMSKVFNLALQNNEDKKWITTTILIPVPQFNSKNIELKVFLWNPAREKCYFDNLKVSIY